MCIAPRIFHCCRKLFLLSFGNFDFICNLIIFNLLSNFISYITYVIYRDINLQYDHKIFFRANVHKNINYH